MDLTYGYENYTQNNFFNKSLASPSASLASPYLRYNFIFYAMRCDLQLDEGNENDWKTNTALDFFSLSES